MNGADEQVYPSGQHYSGNNRIPNIKQFVENLDKQKKHRDAQIDEQQKSNNQNKHQATANGANEGIVPGGSEQRKPGKNRRTVRDPITGHDVEIEDIADHHMKSAEKPMITVPNAALPGHTPSATETHTTPDQSQAEYRRAQDLTAPPAPIAPDTTSDLPIHGEKTNVLFHPTPSVSFEPMYAALEARAAVLCTVIFFGIAIFGGSGSGWGGRLWMVLMGASVAAGVWMWVRQVVSQGRANECKSGFIWALLDQLLPKTILCEV